MAAGGKEDGYHLISLRGKLTSVSVLREVGRRILTSVSQLSVTGGIKVKYQHLHLQVKIIPFLRP